MPDKDYISPPVEDTMAAIRILIVEDETIVAQDIAARLEQAGYHVAAMADTGLEALEVLQKEPIDLVLLDIHLIDSMDGVEVAKKIRSNFSVPLIYLTSLSDRATVERAQSTQPSAYMLKPFNDRELEIAIDMAVANFSTGQPANDPLAVSKSTPVSNGHFFLKDCMFIKDNYRYQRVEISNLLCAEASGNYTQLVFSERSFLITAQLSKIEERLTAPSFMRVHRSYLVNLEKVTAFEGNCLFIGEREIPVSKAHREAVFRHFPMM